MSSVNVLERECVVTERQKHSTRSFIVRMLFEDTFQGTFFIISLYLPVAPKEHLRTLESKELVWELVLETLYSLESDFWSFNLLWSSVAIAVCVQSYSLRLCCVRGISLLHFARFPFTEPSLHAHQDYFLPWQTPRMEGRGLWRLPECAKH